MSRKFVPDVGALFRYDGRRYRVTCWMKLVDPKTLMTGDPLHDILIEAAQKRDGMMMVWCSREQATHVSGSGVCGVIAPVEEITLEGVVDWPKERIERERVCPSAYR